MAHEEFERPKNEEPKKNTTEDLAIFSVPFQYDIDNPPDITPPRVECYLDDTDCIRYMAYIGVIHHEQLIEEILDIWAKIPDLGKYDNLIDLRFHKGNVGWHTVKEIGKYWSIHFGGDAPRKRTAFVSRDITFTILIKAIQAFAPEHTFQAFKTKEDALLWLRKKP